MVIFGGFFAKLGYFAGFSLNIIYIVGRISAAAIAGNIKLLSLGDSVRDYTGAYTVIFRGIFPYTVLLARRNSEAAMGGARSGGGEQGRGTLFFRLPNSLQGCDGWGEGRGILYIKASAVKWKKTPPGGPSLGLKEDILFL